MNDVEKLQLKIQALKETYTRRISDLDDEVANLRVALTEINGNLEDANDRLAVFESEEAHALLENQEDVSSKE